MSSHTSFLFVYLQKLFLVDGNSHIHMIKSRWVLRVWKLNITNGYLGNKKIGDHAKLGRIYIIPSYSEDWPAFATDLDELRKLQESFEDVSISHIPRSRNGRADALAKNARSRGYFFSHINQTQTDGDALRRIDSPALQLI